MVLPKTAKTKIAYLLTSLVNNKRGCTLFLLIFTFATYGIIDFMNIDNRRRLSLIIYSFYELFF